jgi:hypothetical protein
VLAASAATVAGSRAIEIVAVDEAVAVIIIAVPAVELRGDAILRAGARVFAGVAQAIATARRQG